MSDDTVVTQVWFRNPHNYIKEVLEVPDARLIAWDRGMLNKKRIDPQAHGNLFFGKNPDWRALAIGEQGAAEVNFEHGMNDPIAVYPVWAYDVDDLEDLESWIKNPIGENRQACTRHNKPADETPVYGQEHRIILTGMPNGNLSSTKFLLRQIKEIKEDYADTGIVLHLHGSYAYGQMFALGLGASDVDPRTDAANGRVIIPPGKKIMADRASTVTHWINLLDMHPSDLKVPRNRCIYNIKSALWAGANWQRDLRFRTTSRVNMDPADPAFNPEKNNRVILGPKKEEIPGDKIACNTCSLQDSCKYYREDAVCSVPESEMSSLAKAFRSRDAQTVIDGISAVLAGQAQRLERGVELEEDFGELDPEVSKIANQVFNNGVKLAKLLDPSLSKPLVQINGAPSLTQKAGEKVNEKQLIARAVRAIQAETNIDTKDITSDMILAMILRMGNQEQQPAELESGE